MEKQNSKLSCKIFLSTLLRPILCDYLECLTQTSKYHFCDKINDLKSFASALAIVKTTN